MSARIYNIRDYQNPKDLERLRAEQALEQQALEIMSVALMGEPGMCGMEPVIYIEMPEGKEPA